MAKGMSLLDMLMAASAKETITKQKFGRIMHDPYASEEAKQEALQMLRDADGYENLAD
jgi:hypothetical protein